MIDENPARFVAEMSALAMSSLLVANARLARMWWPATPAQQFDLWRDLVAEKTEAAMRAQFAATTAILGGRQGAAILRAGLRPVTRTVEANLRTIAGPRR